jgi:hypothetical protein
VREIVTYRIDISGMGHLATDIGMHGLGIGFRRYLCDGDTLMITTATKGIEIQNLPFKEMDVGDFLELGELR